MKTILILVILLTQNVWAQSSDFKSWEEIKHNLEEVDGNSKALSHIECFFKHYEETSFLLKQVKDPKFSEMCSSSQNIEFNKKRVFALIDYTKKSNIQRMLLIDRKTGKITKMAVAHGRFKASMINVKLRKNKNSIRDVKYFSNELGSNAPSSGFFIAGQVNEKSKWGRSVILHGLEENINDNACEREVVIHKFSLITPNNVFMLSSGCPMVAPKNIDHVISLLKGESDEEMHLTKGGALVFIYGPREEAWSENTCEGNFRF